MFFESAVQDTASSYRGHNLRVGRCLGNLDCTTGRWRFNDRIGYKRPVKLSLKAMIIAGALFKAAVFLLISLMNLILRPYGGAYLAILSSLYPGYDPVSPLAVIVGTVYSLLAGALGGLLFSCLYNFFAARKS